MGRKVISALVLLLLVSVQTFAADCDVRCSAMTAGHPSSHKFSSDNSAINRPGRAHCHGMDSGRVFFQQAGATLSSQPCVSHICTGDWTFARSTNEVGLSQLPAADRKHIFISVDAASLIELHADPFNASITPLAPLLFGTRLRV
jgi:hypothetical protein